MGVKLNNSENYESILIHITEKDTPIAFKNKLNELMSQKAFDNEEEAKKWIEESEFELELYYHENFGLFGVESEAVESNCDIYSPYDGTLCEY